MQRRLSEAGAVLKPNDLAPETLGALFDQSTDCVKLLDPEGRVVWMNANGQTIMDIADFCAVEGELWAEFWPEPQRPAIEAAMADGAESSTYRFRGPCPTQGGRLKHWDVTVSPVVTSAGEHAGFLAISRDISAEAEARVALETATVEMRHRLNNVFATASSLVTAHLRVTDSVEGFASAMSDRLAALAEVQTLFDRTRGPVRLLEIVSTVLAPFRSSRCEIEIGTLPDLSLDGLAGDSVALVLGELCVHSTKHGALGHAGKIRIAVHVEGRDMTLDWSEKVAQALPSHAGAGSRGLAVIARIMAQRGDTLSVEASGQELTASLALRLDG